MPYSTFSASNITSRETLGEGRPHKLFGREQSKEQLLEIISRSSRGYGQVLLVPGHSGVGKTSLVEWLKEPVQLKNGIFVQGKFDQYQQGTPYYAIRQALSALWREVSTAYASEIDELCNRIRNDLGDLGYLLIELVPELDTVIDRNPLAEEINPYEAQHRFIAVIRDFLRIVSQPEHPVIVFVDDWQWADPASMELLRRINVGTMLRYFLFIVAFRDEVVTDVHPLAPVLVELHSQLSPPETVHVGDLETNDLRNFIKEMLRGKVSRLEEFVKVIQEKTDGNPFYVRAFMEYLQNASCLRFDSSAGCWMWNVESWQLPSDIIDLFGRKLAAFEPSAQQLVSRAACLGNRFDLAVLGDICGHSPQHCRSLLSPIIAEGLLVDESTSLSKQTLPADESAGRLAFMHDRVQQAAFLMLQPGETEVIHLQIGRQLLDRFGPRGRDEHLYEILEHLNEGGELIDNVAEKHLMVELNITAAKKAEAATAFGAMLQFYRAAHYFAGCIGDDISHFWKTSYDMALQLFRGLAWGEFIVGSRDEAERIIQQSLAFTRTNIEQAESLNVMIVHYTLMAKYSEAIATGRKALHGLGVFLPEDDYEMYRDAEIAECRAFLKDQPVASLYDSPFMDNLEKRTVAKLLITLGPPCYRVHQRLWSVLVAKVINLTLRYGLIPQVGYSHTAFGGLLGWVSNDYATAREFGKLAERIMTTKVESLSDKSVFYLMIGSSIRHWFSPLSDASGDFQRAYEIGLQSGNMQYAAYAFGHNMYCSFYQGVPLEQLNRLSHQSLVFSKSRLNQWAIDLLEGGNRVILRLTGPSGRPGELTNDSEYIAQVAENNNIQVMCIYHVLKTFADMLLGNNDEALISAEKADSLLYTVGTQGLLPWPEHVFCRFLLRSSLYSDASEASRREWSEQLRGDLAQLAIWADQCPDNYTHKYLLASAELSRIEHRPLDALTLYDKAIKEASFHNFVQWEGIANERASRFWQNLGNAAMAQVYWHQAYICYSRWGAQTKLDLMERDYTARLNGWLHDVAEWSHGSRSVSADAVDSFREKHVKLLRTQSQDKLEAELHTQVTLEAQELADATDRLRMEVAERKRLEEERSRLEEQIRHTRKMEAIGTLAGGIAHEFNNMLTIIIGNLDLAKDELQPGAPAGDFLDEIQTASLRARDVVQKLHRFARKGPVNKIPVQLQTVIEEGVGLLRKTIPATVTIRSSLHCQSATVLADPTEINQVLINLCNNSVQAMADATGVLEISLDSVELTSQNARRRRAVDLTPGQYVRLTVSDSGCGVSPEILERVFDPYFTTKDVDEGLGMGLAVVLGIVKNHDGEITMTSEVGRGTQVTVLLPQLETSSVAREGQEDIQVQAAAGKRILFVDDEQAIVTLNKKILEKEGYRVVAETAPEEALKRFQGSPYDFDLVISDMTMPVMTGTTLVARIKKVRPDIPVIVCTGHSDWVDDECGKDMGIDAYLKKPVSRDELRKLIRKVLVQ